MITTKLRKQCNTKSLMVEFSNLPLPPPLQQFYRTSQQQGIQILRGNLKLNQLNFYYIESEKSIEIKNVRLNNIPQALSFILSVIYINADAQQQQLQKQVPQRRTLLVREGLDMKFHLYFEFQNTQSQFQTVMYLCQLSAAIINSRMEKDLDFYDQKTQEIKGTVSESIKEKLWRNIFFQIPGLGKEKCLAICQKYPNYQSLLLDFQTKKQLKNVLISKGTKEIKLGSILANRIYRCLFNQNGLQSIYEQ